MLISDTKWYDLELLFEFSELQCPIPSGHFPFEKGTSQGSAYLGLMPSGLTALGVQGRRHVLSLANAHL